jgi:hypothetical protein
VRDPTRPARRETTPIEDSACPESSSLAAALSSAVAAVFCVTFSICEMACVT